MTISFDETKRLRDSLLNYGFSELVWVTAEFAPFTSAMKPDIYFAPTKRPYTGRSILFEVNRKFVSFPNHPVDFFIERKQFAEEYLKLAISRFVILNGQGVDELLKRRLAKLSITFLEIPSEPEDFLNSLSYEAIL